MAKHSPAPWRCIRVPHTVHGAYRQVCDAGNLVGHVVSFVGPDGRTAESQARRDADAALFREAPALLAAAKDVLAGLDARVDAAVAAGGPAPVFDGIAELHTAIARAEGSPYG